MFLAFVGQEPVRHSQAHVESREDKTSRLVSIVVEFECAVQVYRSSRGAFVVLLKQSRVKLAHSLGTFQS